MSLTAWRVHPCDDHVLCIRRTTWTSQAQMYWSMMKRSRQVAGASPWILRHTGESTVHHLAPTTTTIPTLSLCTTSQLAVVAILQSIPSEIEHLLIAL